MHDHDGLGFVRDLRLDIGRTQSKSFLLAFTKNRHCPQPKHGNHRGPKRGSRHNHLVPRLKVDREKRRHQCRRPIVVGKRKFAANERGVLLLQFTGDRVRCDVPRAHDLDNGLLIFLRQNRPTIGLGLRQGHRWFAAEYRRGVSFLLFHFVEVADRSIDQMFAPPGSHNREPPCWPSSLGRGKAAWPSA